MDSQELHTSDDGPHRLFRSVEKHPLLWLGGLLVAAFLAGVSAVTFIHQRVKDEVESRMRTEIQNSVRAEVESRVKLLQSGSSISAFPIGAVVAFELAKCPESEGWSDYRPAMGRVILGVGEGNRDRNGTPLTPRKLNEDGGEERHKLTIEEMPKHDHAVYQHAGYHGGDTPGADGSDTKTKVHAAVTSPRGEGAPYNVMPPFVSLRYCIKAR